MIPQIVPDWTKQYSNSSNIEEDLVGLKFDGPGLYLTATDTVLIEPLPPHAPAVGWGKDRVDGTIYRVYCYGNPIEKTVFSLQDSLNPKIPVRQEYRQWILDAKKKQEEMEELKGQAGLNPGNGVVSNG